MKAEPGLARDTLAIERALEQHGLLLVHDAKLPSASAIVAGEPVHGSWWAHPSGKRLFGALEALEDRGLVTAPLLLGKITLVHPRLVPSLVAACRARERWQLAALGMRAAEILALLDRIEQSGEVRDLSASDRGDGKKLAAALLVLGRQEHGERGAHVTVLESWAHFTKRRSIPELPATTAGRAALEAAVHGWTAPKLFPWSPKR
jgi:hypothetical protein